jgi:hypothetical protein
LFEMNATYGMRTENSYSQFNEERLLTTMSTTEGAKLALGDVNGDGYQDIYQCGAAGAPGQLFFGSDWYGFELALQQPFDEHAASEDTDAAFFDYDGDGDLDLYVASGSENWSTMKMPCLSFQYAPLLSQWPILTATA